ncbi:helix-turn-helix transcriptional regulator [Streptomyces niveiscabiei]|uniref:helix-turn-helix domain-containing protein n=1 Tax=Streptomyces niveiscabiei TaxID=164115 RepID=UPI0029A2EC06|nr:helix-turn-helix transcriptional regulator [Streptomyces niveiscabiei]MDX3386720.1 helix-turn-helix transcriptional regulator [Streptomyces niveiscabiei]
MASRQGPTLRQRKLGADLKRLREAAGIGQKEAAGALDAQQSKMSKIETGRLRLRRLELQALLDLYGVKDEQVRADLITLLRESGQRQYFPEYNLGVNLREIVELEAECTRIEAFSAMHLTGLLQIPEYAYAMIYGFDPWRTPEDVQHYVDLRMARQEIFKRERPPQVVCVLDEGAIRRPVGGPAVMRKQLGHLLELTNESYLTIQVVPFEQAVYAGLHGAFRTIINDDATTLDVVEVSTRAKALYMQDAADVEVYRKLFDDIRASALSSRQTADLIRRVMKDFEGADESR